MPNLFQAIPAELGEEFFDQLIATEGLRLERIVSRGQATPENQWYDQPWCEWVCLLKGSALLSFEDGETLRLAPGDHVLIEAHRRHRVEWTDKHEDTVWLALHYPPGSGTLA